MKKIKETLIHWLGGYTETDVRNDSETRFNDGYKKGFFAGCRTSDESFDKGYWQGKKAIFDSLMQKADELYGTPADDWCKEMYSFILSIRKKL